MSRYNVEITTIEGVLNWYDSFDYPNWNIYHQKPDNIKAMGSDDPEISLNKLVESLQMLSNDSAIENTYYLQLQPKDKKAPKPVISFCLKKQTSTIAGVPMGYYATKQDVDEIKQMIMGKDIDDEIDDLPEPEQKNILAGLLENPQVQTMLVSAISGLLGSFIVPSNVKTISGVSENVDDILNVLFSKGVKLEHLKKLSDMPKEKIQMLISML